MFESFLQQTYIEQALPMMQLHPIFSHMLSHRDGVVIANFSRTGDAPAITRHFRTLSCRTPHKTRSHVLLEIQDLVTI